ncbi:alcohol dehydrogenase-like 1 [Cryptomeria japonica]|uniref:alcohol dehydrogenase-like 1 n=1 Tax=Cryptomeria japonica TaxID=3369 RepID=UPI0027D9F839|nr:alcohol dehydrogenase-like 1 [Cryptomeria japonica]
MPVALSSLVQTSSKSPSVPVVSTVGVVVAAPSGAVASVVDGDPIVGAKVHPRPSSFAGGQSIAHVTRFAAHPLKGIHPLPCAKTSHVVVCGQEVVENVDFYQCCALRTLMNGGFVEAAVCWAPGEALVMEEIQVAPPHALEVRIGIICTALCHTDLSIWNLKQEDNTRHPRIYGHEAVGRVESVGENVKGIEEGDMVIPVFRPHCTECVDCKSTQSNMCDISSKSRIEGLMKSENGTRFSINGKPIYHFVGVSSFSEFTVVGVDQVVKINPMAAPDKVCLLSCGVTTGLGGVWKVGNVEKGSTVAVFGLGTIGMAVIQGCRIRGVSRIIGVDVNPIKIDIGTVMIDLNLFHRCYALN